MLDHYDVHGKNFTFGIRPTEQREPQRRLRAFGMALLNAAADLDAMVCGARYAAEASDAEHARDACG
ncbi:hypothetical protein P0W64_10725 [Tsukamurella sp. 8F]|uniref:hypothetical protein n=1 Tax=unclassified Tsukamurella TaxID=2633480 RepID=UPI0023BA0E66|nr:MULTISPECIES: hypothetical protein [unclassified Tsukamurella]MDF0529982.1 hypothetical protein [Tsukamurella sp. 8J]MDF0587246.1 hypothetical protein [Tsukamurella sp. 8F]